MRTLQSTSLSCSSSSLTFFLSSLSFCSPYFSFVFYPWAGVWAFKDSLPLLLAGSTFEFLYCTRLILFDVSLQGFKGKTGHVGFPGQKVSQQLFGLPSCQVCLYSHNCCFLHVFDPKLLYQSSVYNETWVALLISIAVLMHLSLMIWSALCFPSGRCWACRPPGIYWKTWSWRELHLFYSFQQCN